MKLSCAFTLALIPASAAFAPVGLKSSTSRTDSSLNGYLKKLFGDRSDDKEEQTRKQSRRFIDSVVKGLERLTGDVVVPPPANTKPPKHVVQGNFDYMPTKEMTGVETHICRLAATMAQQCYDIQRDKKDTFKLSTKDHEVETILVTKQGKFQPTSPTFGAAVCGDTMILAWRGSDMDGAPMDFINDMAFSPCTNIAWRNHAKTLKLHGAMTSLCANDIATYEETIIAECKKRGIKEIVTTGHSLGGGIAQVAHTILRAQIQEESSPWSELNGDVNVRSVVFSAPMTTVLLEEYTEKTEQFMEEINDNSCILIFSNDPVPRCYGYISFIEDIVDDVIPYLSSTAAKKVPVPNFLLQRTLDKFMKKKVVGLMENERFNDLLTVMAEYVHPGNIIYYESPESRPRVLGDRGFAYVGQDTDTFRSVRYKGEKNVNPLDEILAWHNDIIGAPGLSYDDSVLH